MATSIKLRVKWAEQTEAIFKLQGMNIDWSEAEVMTITCQDPPLTIDDISSWIEARVEDLYHKQTRGQDSVQVQTRSIKKLDSSDMLPWGDYARDHLRDSDTIVVNSIAMTESMAMRRRTPRYSERDLEEIRKQLRFGLNDRVVCYCGPRWFSGSIVGTAVMDEDTPLPYLVKTDPLPGLPGRTISVPSDTDEICVQEVCFDAQSELHLVKAAATLLTGSTRPKLRFAVGDKIACRLKSNPKDGLERWVSGTVSSVWPELPGPLRWDMGDVAGEYPKVVAYKVDLETGGSLYCHRDHHTLIRREGMQPQMRVKGISKRMEVRVAKDGSKESVDHQTERRKRIRDLYLDSDSD
mmetsp:Transcript_41416/g.81869  ORF Transcript_41416/g.81869 Transcript_41416/m.81869 type:complete len:352 (+) Transcript_41416:70-1125(+)|eukprot:CAMPEP_0172683686 /NCGR_PEP_ID=MMETSP1074-20121228/19033_1 /TAXON_ID=2916 /ORGANISM="Ceratium fusus, Strain PA161109" /LENGTH=351 /DNA_ID=CAMNT_0013502577 /DNA_START=42 /DNA_END=1097 /DNA_ORIENTATION=-